MAKPPPKPKRARGVPIQVYLSKTEHKQLRAICRKREATVADLVRRFLWRATQESRLANKPKKRRRPAPAAIEAPDPRQLDITAAIHG